jgi:hypothetical protein
MDGTVILGPKDEVQPDLLLRILPEFGGQTSYLHSQMEGVPVRFIKGAPEMVAEVAYSSIAIDLHRKRERYLRAGVIEYIVVNLATFEIEWFDFRNKCRIKADADGIFRSQFFPGLWIHAKALFKMDYRKSMDVLNKGLASHEHEAFAAKLAASGPYLK